MGWLLSVDEGCSGAVMFLSQIDAGEDRTGPQGLHTGAVVGVELDLIGLPCRAIAGADGRWMAVQAGADAVGAHHFDHVRSHVGRGLQVAIDRRALPKARLKLGPHLVAEGLVEHPDPFQQFCCPSG